MSILQRTISVLAMPLFALTFLCSTPQASSVEDDLSWLKAPEGASGEANPLEDDLSFMAADGAMGEKVLHEDHTDSSLSLPAEGAIFSYCDFSSPHYHVIDELRGQAVRLQKKIIDPTQSDVFVKIAEQLIVKFVTQGCDMHSSSDLLYFASKLPSDLLPHVCDSGNFKGLMCLNEQDQRWPAVIRFRAFLDFMPSDKHQDTARMLMVLANRFKSFPLVSIVPSAFCKASMFNINYNKATWMTPNERFDLFSKAFGLVCMDRNVQIETWPHFRQTIRHIYEGKPCELLPLSYVPELRMSHILRIMMITPKRLKNAFKDYLATLTYDSKVFLNDLLSQIPEIVYPHNFFSLFISLRDYGEHPEYGNCVRLSKEETILTVQYFYFNELLDGNNPMKADYYDEDDFRTILYMAPEDRIATLKRSIQELMERDSLEK